MSDTVARSSSASTGRRSRLGRHAGRLRSPTGSGRRCASCTPSRTSGTTPSDAIAGVRAAAMAAGEEAALGVLQPADDDRPDGVHQCDRYIPHFGVVRRPADGRIGSRRSVDDRQDSVVLGESDIPHSSGLIAMCYVMPLTVWNCGPRYAWSGWPFRR
jgi:hypothetical protein